MTTTPDREAEIKRLHYAEHWRVGTIVAQLGVHEDVVRRILGLLAQRPPRPRHVCLVEPYADFVAETLKLYPRLRSTRLYDMIKPRGYTGSVRTLRSHVAKVRPKPKREAFLELHFFKGEQAQVDWAYVGKVPVPGGERPLWLFVMVLSWSRALWAEFVFETTAYSLCRSLVRASTYFGGCTRKWLFDNAKAVVLERYGDAARFHPGLVDLQRFSHRLIRTSATGQPTGNILWGDL